MREYVSREIRQLFNEFGDEIELEIIRYNDHYNITATICQDEPPFKDYIGIGKDGNNRRKAIQKALKELHLHTYSN